MKEIVVMKKKKRENQAGSEKLSAAGRRHTSEKSYNGQDLDNEEAQQVIANESVSKHIILGVYSPDKK